MRSTKILRIKNFVLAALTVVYFVFCKVTSYPLIVDGTAVSSQPREVGAYIKSNLAFIAIFLLFFSVATTSFLLGYLIYRKFDRNRAAAQTAVRGGLFFLFTALYIVTGTNTLDVFSEHINTLDFLSCIGLLFSGLMYASFITSVYKKKWTVTVEWIFSLAIVAVFVLGLSGVPSVVMVTVFGCYNMGMLVMMLCCTFIQTRVFFSRKNVTKAMNTVSGILQMAFLLAAAVCMVTRVTRMYWLFFSGAVAVMAFLEFSELMNLAARQYIHTADAENYRKMAYVDALCNISNRNAFMVEQNETYDSDSLYYVVFDVNNLKRINDMFGHGEGDVVIKNAARLIYKHFRGIGKCYRIGGDEFAVIGKYKTAEEIKSCLQQMTKEIETYNETASAKLDLAFGYAIRNNTEINTYELFNRADKEMYRYKRRSKSGFATA